MLLLSIMNLSVIILLEIGWPFALGQQKQVGQLCTTNSDCDSVCCALTLISAIDRIQYLCKPAEHCKGNLIYGSSCVKSSECSSNCCFNDLCSEFDVCFQEYVKPIIDSVVISTASLLGVSTAIVWIWIIYLCRKDCKATEFHGRLRERIETILKQRNDPIRTPTTRGLLREETKSST